MAQYSLARLRPDYERLWTGMVVTNRAGATRDANTILRGKKAYLRVQKECNVPWWFVGLTHLRESNCNFSRWLHNGDPMRDRNGRPLRTVRIPAGRPPNPAVDWFAGAYDALVILKGLNRVNVWGFEHVAYWGEAFNGFGYRNPRINIPSPYLWGGTNRQRRGKFIRDRKYDANTWDTQLGIMAVLKMLMELDPDVKFGEVALSDPENAAQRPADDDVPEDWEHGIPPEPTEEDDAAPITDDVAPMPSAPYAGDRTQRQAKPLRKSRTIWGAITSWLGGVGASLMAMLSYLQTPWGFAIFMVFVIILSVAAYLIISGRINSQKLVEHLSPDDDDEGDDFEPMGRG